LLLYPFVNISIKLHLFYGQPSYNTRVVQTNVVNVFDAGQEAGPWRLVYSDAAGALCHPRFRGSCSVICL
jgi:hypothetical protein